MFNIVLVEPEIPNNTGNIGRTCLGTDCQLHLIEPFGFEINDKQLKRAGLDYWPNLRWHRHASFEAWKSTVPDFSRVFFFSKKAAQVYTDVELRKGDWLVFGKETKGLPEELINQHSAQAIYIPMSGPIRSLNLANAVAVAIYEGLRQSRVSAKIESSRAFIDNPL